MCVAPRHGHQSPAAYRNLVAPLYAYFYAELSRRGIDVAALSQLVGHPTQFPSATMVDWETGRPNATYWVVKLIRQHFGPGDKLVDGRVLTPPQPALLPAYVYAQGFVTLQGKRKILLINKRDRAFEVSLLGAAGAQVEVVDQTTGSRPPEASTLPRDELILKGLAVAAVTLP